MAHWQAFPVVLALECQTKRRIWLTLGLCHGFVYLDDLRRFLWTCIGSFPQLLVLSSNSRLCCFFTQCEISQFMTDSNEPEILCSHCGNVEYKLLWSWKVLVSLIGSLYNCSEGNGWTLLRRWFNRVVPAINERRLLSGVLPLISTWWLITKPGYLMKVGSQGPKDLAKLRHFFWRIGVESLQIGEVSFQKDF